MNSLAPMLIKQRHNRIWPSTEILSGPGVYNIDLYAANDSAFPLLIRPMSYFSWRYPKYPEDLSFFRNNRCWLYASSHEEYIEVYPQNRSEYDLLINMGLEIRDSYKPVLEKELFFEQY